MRVETKRYLSSEDKMLSFQFERLKCVIEKLTSELEIMDKDVHLKGWFGPLWSQKMKVAFHQLLLIG